ncbi:hypothetical protein BYT27DRAFT_7131792 [Phlegmacium glaucopus]|nr:hypothetical protein BYT27DRAFT_7131792 [Phlegmacium glaucopus]
MTISRPSLEMQKHEKAAQAAKALQTRFQNIKLQLVDKVSELNSHKMDSDEELESGDIKNRDPAIVATDVAAQMAYLRKLKFQYLEQNAKDKYLKSIVSDIDDAPIVTAEENKELSLLNEERKERLKVAKENLAEGQQNIRLLAPLVEQDYQKIKQMADRAASLAQKIIDTRTSLMLLRQRHPQPRLTIPLADKTLAEQVTEMQTLNDEVQAIKQETKADKERVKSIAQEVVNVRIEATEAEKAVDMSQLEEDDSRLVPLYDWYTASLALQRSLCDLEDSYSASENELGLTYKIDRSPNHPHQITITLIFTADTRQLAAVQTSGLDEIGVEVGDLIAAHVQVNEVHGLVAAILARARAVVSR